MKRCIPVLLLVALYGCAPSVSKEQIKEDVQGILSRVLDSYELQGLMHSSIPRDYYFSYGKAPLYNDQRIEKPVFDLTIPEARTIYYRDTLESQLHTVCIVIDNMTVKNDSATVYLSVPVDGLTGKFNLIHDDHWRIIDRELMQD